jgi:hypothetical protein
MFEPGNYSAILKYGNIIRTVKFVAREPKKGKMRVSFRRRAAEEAKRKEELERRLAQKKEFDRQWRINAQKVMDAHPELTYENSLYSQAMRKVLSSNPVYSQRLDGFELAYKVIMNQLPPPTNPRRAMPTSELNRLLERLKVDASN